MFGHRHLLLGFVAAVTVAVVAVLLLLGGDDDDSVDIGLAPTTTPTPISTPSPATPLSAEEQARNFKIAPVTGEAAFISSGTPVPDSGRGVYYQNVVTGVIEGWSLLLPSTNFEAFSTDNRFNSILRREQLFHDGVVYYEGAYLADRATGTVYWLNGATPVNSTSDFNGRNLASQEDRVLFMIRGEQGEEWFVVLDMDPAPTVVSRFLLSDMWSDPFDTTWALFSSDGSKLAVFGRKGYVVDASTGSATSVVTSPIQFPGSMTLLNVIGGTSMIVIQEDARQDIANWYRIGWNGQILAEGSGGAVYPSPDGTHVAVFRGARPYESMNWSALEAFRTQDGSPVFRVTGASAWIGGYSGVNRWLADNSGFVISDSRLQMSLALRDGTFRPYVGLPAPDSANRFGQGGSIRDRDGNVIAFASFPVHAADFVPPFGESSDEIRYRVPHGGHDCCQGIFSLIEPYIEMPPYVEPLRLKLSQDAVGEQILNSALTGQPVGTIRSSGFVTVHETTLVCTDLAPTPSSGCTSDNYSLQLDFLIRHQGGSPDATIGLSGYWARVTTEDGVQGWLLLSVRPRGI